MTHQSKNWFKQESHGIAKMTAMRIAPYMWMPWKISEVPGYAHGYFCQLLLMDCCCDRSY